MAENIIMGGGSINESPRRIRTTAKGTTSTNCNTVPTASSSSSSSSKTNYDPQHNHAHLLHSIMGLDRYPNYISRWSYNIDDIDKLQDALTHQLEKVKHQKSNLIQRRKRMNEIIEHAMASYQDIDWTVLTVPLSWEQVRSEILHEDASKAIFQSRLFKSVDGRPELQDVLEGKVHVQLDLGLLEDWLHEEFFDVYSMPLLSRSFCIRLKTSGTHHGTIFHFFQLSMNLPSNNFYKKRRTSRTKHLST